MNSYLNIIVHQGFFIFFHLQFLFPRWITFYQFAFPSIPNSSAGISWILCYKTPPGKFRYFSSRGVTVAATRTSENLLENSSFLSHRRSRNYALLFLLCENPRMRLQCATKRTDFYSGCWLLFIVERHDYKSSLRLFLFY